MVNTLAHLDRKVAFLFALLYGLAAAGIAVWVLVAVPAGLANTPILRVPLENLATPALGEGNSQVLKAAYATADVQPGAFFLMELDVWPVAVGLGAAALASMFETGRRQQVELDGLV